jgi:peptidoglycan/xylan/chitin deacetylase (PgdA/CDA1 family)
MISPRLTSIAKQGAFFLAGNLTPWLQSIVESPLWILMYHRVLPASDERFGNEEPGMVVTPETFLRHIQALKKLFTIVSLTEWIDRCDTGKPLPPRACAITFDDGWLDNFEFALPILQQEQVPATLFAVSHMVGTSSQFWPNRVARLIGNSAEWQKNSSLAWLRDLGGDYAAGFTDRENLGHIIAKLKQLPDSELSDRLDEAEKMSGIALANTPALVNWDQLRAMQNTGLVEIGSHTCHHFRLTEQLPADILEQEIVESRKELERQLEKPVSLFCYPNGDASAQAIKLVQQHYTAAVTTRRGINSMSTSPHQLLRIGVHEQISNTSLKFRAKLSGWL